MQYTKTADLAKVAKTNDYNDLDNLPEIPDVSGIKPYTDALQDSSNTAPTSKALYDAVQTVNEEVGKKANSSDLEDYAKKTDIPTDYLTEDDLEPYAKSEDVPEIDDESTDEDNVWSAKKVNDSLVDKVDTSELEKYTLKTEAPTVIADAIKNTDIRFTASELKFETMYGGYVATVKMKPKLPTAKNFIAFANMGTVGITGYPVTFSYNKSADTLDIWVANQGGASNMAIVVNVTYV